MPSHNFIYSCLKHLSQAHHLTECLHAFLFRIKFYEYTIIHNITLLFPFRCKGTKNYSYIQIISQKKCPSDYFSPFCIHRVHPSHRALLACYCASLIPHNRQRQPGDCLRILTVLPLPESQLFFNIEINSCRLMTSTRWNGTSFSSLKCASSVTMYRALQANAQSTNLLSSLSAWI